MNHSDVDKEFLNQIKNIYNLFDLMALCIGFLYQKVSGGKMDFLEVLQRCGDELELEINTPLDIYMYNRKYDKEKECFAALKRQLYEILSGCIDLCEASVLIILWMDNHVEPSYDSDDVHSYTSLNGQFKNIKIIPRLNENWLNKFSNDHKTGDYELLREPSLTNYPDITKLICQYIIFDKEMIDEYNLQIVHLGINNLFVKKLNERDEKKQTLSFAVFPVLYTDFQRYLKIDKIESTAPSLQHMRYFEILGMQSSKEKILKSRYEKIFERCKGKDIDFLVFPELMMTEDIFNEFRYDDNLKSIKFWGSIWKDRKNKCYITGPTGKILSTYNKKAGYEYEDEETGKTYMEHIPIEKPAKYVIIDLEGVARIGLCICRDLTFEKARTIFKYVETNILIVPSYSPSRDLYGYAEELAKLNRCIVLVGNSCSAFYDPDVPDKTCKETGFMVMPAKQGTSSRAVYKRAYGNEECVSDCGEYCIGKLFTLDFSGVMCEQGIKTVEIDNSSL